MNLKTTYLLLLIGILFYGCKREDNIFFRTRVYVTAIDGNTGLPVKDAIVSISGYNELDNYHPYNSYSENYKDFIKFDGKTDEEGKYEIKFRTKSRRKYTFYGYLGVFLPNYASPKFKIVEPKGGDNLKIGKLNNYKLTFY